MSFEKTAPPNKSTADILQNSIWFQLKTFFANTQLSPLKNRGLISAIKIFVKHNKTFDKNKKNIYNNLAS